MEFLNDYGLFVAKIITALAALGVLAAIIGNASSTKSKSKGHLEISSLNDDLEKINTEFVASLVPPHNKKAFKKTQKKAEKKLAKQKAGKGNAIDTKNRVFVLNFHGDLRASAVASLRQEVTAVLAQTQEGDEVVIKLESAGGLVHGYGLAASQLDRIRKQNIALTTCIDKVAASGGYMMACVADQVIAAPFAIVGSIGVVAQIPNIHRLLKRHDVDVELMTAGKYKRTLTVLGENTEEGREKFREDLEETHDLFKEYVAARRPQVDIEKVATGEIWYGSRAEAVGLVDAIKTSDEYLTGLVATKAIYEVKYVEKKSLPQRLGLAAEESSDRLLVRWLDRLLGPRHYS